MIYLSQTDYTTVVLCLDTTHEAHCTQIQAASTEVNLKHKPDSIRLTQLITDYQSSELKIPRLFTRKIYYT